MVNRLLAATVACAAVAGLAATAAFAGPGDVGAGARTYVAAETFGGNAAGRGDFWNETITATGGRAVSEYDYPPLPTPVPSGFTCPPGGCAMWDASAFGGVDVAAGRLQAYASTHILTGGNDISTAGYSSVSGSSYLDDTITLSRAATVRLEGVAHAVTDSGNSHHEWYSDPRMELTVRAMFSQDDWSNETGIRELGGFSESFWIETSGCPYPMTCAAGPDVPLPGPNVISVPFAIEVELPAGESNFNAVFDADIDILVWGALGDPHRAWHSESARIDGTSTLSFAIHVPDDVVATSGSGLLPIVGGAAEETDDEAPAVVCADAPTEWSAANVTIACTATDTGSGLADEANASFELSTDVADGVETATAATGTREVCDVAGNCATAGPIEGLKVDRKGPTIVFAGNSGTYALTDDVAITCTATDGGSGLGSSTCPGASGLAYTFGPGETVLAATAVDAVGNTSSSEARFTVVVTSEGLEALIDRLVGKHGVANALKAQLRNAPRHAFEHLVRAQVGGALTAEDAELLLELVAAL